MDESEELASNSNFLCVFYLMSTNMISLNRRYARHDLVIFDSGGSVHHKKSTCIDFQVITVSIIMLGICVLLKLSYYLVNGHHAMLADGHKECQKPELCIIFEY